MSERKQRDEETLQEVSDEANLPGVDPDELPGVGDLEQKLVEEEAETPRGSTEAGGPFQKPKP
jgi:hypothetical protein